MKWQELNVADAQPALQAGLHKSAPPLNSTLCITGKVAKMEEVEEDEIMPNKSAEELTTVLHGVHCDNSKLQYYAERLGGGRRVSQMPVTPFVYEFFLFNSLYQVDWVASSKESGLVFHPEDFSEPKKQKALINFTKQHACRKPSDLYRAFEPLIHIGKAEGEWTAVTPDSRITIVAGKKFFSDILQLQGQLEECKSPSDVSTSNKVFDILKDCTYFIYLVRNNIFHGSKTLGEIFEPNQKRRIEVYDLFLKGITSLFFLASGKDTAACDFVPCPIYSSSLPTTNAGEVADQSIILEAIGKNFMKIGDSRLVSKFTKVVAPPPLENTPNDKSSLFYPSAGTDFLTPLLLGLPYCTQFYFFESHQPRQLPIIHKLLSRLKGLRISSKPPQWETAGDRHYFDFEFNGTPRRLHWVHADNKAFFQEDAELKFYFHRGDSAHGAVGSGQEWDSKLLPELLKMTPSSSSCVYLTDGEPGGFDERHSAKVFENLPFIESGGRTYYCGKFSPAATNA